VCETSFGQISVEKYRKSRKSRKSRKYRQLFQHLVDEQQTTGSNLPLTVLSAVDQLSQKSECKSNIKHLPNN
jgi:hypothetical protein